MSEQDINYIRGNVEDMKPVSVKQVIVLIGFFVTVTFSGAGAYFRFEQMEKDFQALEKTYHLEMEALKEQHKKDLQAVREEGRWAINALQETMKSNEAHMDDKYKILENQGKGELEAINNRMNTIRDRQNARLERLEEKNSDRN